MPELEDAEASVTRIERTWGRLAELAKSPVYKIVVHWTLLSTLMITGQTI